MLILEPLARGVVPWWPEMAQRVTALGGRVDEWKMTVEVPAIVRLLGTAAGLNYRELRFQTIFFLKRRRTGFPDRGPGDAARGAGLADVLFSALRMDAQGGTSPGRYGTLFPLTLTAVGVVYGDIGTSPLYAIRECFFGSHSVGPTHENVLGVLSLVLYALLLVISIKYTGIVMRADNQGEGGILSLTASCPRETADETVRAPRFSSPSGSWVLRCSSAKA